MSTGEKPKLYQLKCSCGWRMFSDGSDESFAGLYEYGGCMNCGGGRIFRCQQCGHQVRAKRVLDAPPPPKLERPKPIGYVGQSRDAVDKSPPPTPRSVSFRLAANGDMWVDYASPNAAGVDEPASQNITQESRETGVSVDAIIKKWNQPSDPRAEEDVGVRSRRR